MKKASIVSTGNELLNGQTVNTNAAYLGEELFRIGVPVVSCYTVSDELQAIVRALRLAVEDADVVIMTGGLGPTEDDLTRNALAEFLGRELEFREELYQKIKAFFAARGMDVPEKTKVQAYQPAGAEAFSNDLGTADGIFAEQDGKLFFALSGVPAEMEQMFRDFVQPRVGKLAAGQAVAVRKLKCFGQGESSIAGLIGDMMARGRNPVVNCTASHSIITLSIVATAEDYDTAVQMAQKDEKLLREKLGSIIYGSGEQSLAEVVGQELARQGKTIAVAESCTGGLLAKLLTDVAGASGYFRCGWVTYINEAKISELGVEADLIDRYGAVSGEVAAVMAKGALGKSGADYAIGITGIAGPGGGSKEKPVGLVYISVDCDDNCQTEKFMMSGNREAIRFRAANMALNMLRLKLQD